MKVVASRSVSHIRILTNTVANRLRQKLDVDNLSHSANDLVLGIAPISYNFRSIASVDNDIIWVSASVLGIILVTVLGILFVRSRRGSEYAWEEYQKDKMSEAMLGQMSNPVQSVQANVQNVPPAIDLGPPVENVPEDMTVSDLYD